MRHDGDDDYGLPHVEVVVPDDARELEADITAYRREERRRLQRVRMARILGPLTRHGIAAPLIAGALVIALVSGALMTFFGPRVPAPQPTMSLTTPTPVPGEVGGVLPDVRLRWDGREHPAEEMRPALIVIVPSGCACSEALVDLTDQAFNQPVKVFMMADRRRSGLSVADAHKELAAVSGPAGKAHKGVPVLVDDVVEAPKSRFAEKIGASELSVVLVNAGGKIVDVRIELRRVPDLEVERALNA
ncbi:hypothetical protein [Actinocorallia longicatena]|uniref:Redoxin domain-containing protein n=1 Tax=Actinocorallia longicatena TaxID=111803 RepID=A0ABP6QES7_9ACTN